MSDTTIVHLLRHGEVENPRGVVYGRLPDYHLSAKGLTMAAAAADFFAERAVVSLFSSPLERAVETATPVARRLSLEIVTDQRLIEPWNHFEGMKFGVGDGSLRRPQHWPALINPFKPSWGEPYHEVVDRMGAMLAAAREAAAGREAVCVSHQLPIWITRRHAEGRRLWHNPAMRECALGSVTSFTFSGDRLSGVSYVVPYSNLPSRTVAIRTPGPTRRPVGDTDAAQ
ncbi:MAG: histidine phosphatase family protein [Streptosporangiaceae bacterium]|nr:histidine phosphatase family protein [Streptosporangiaceae bacterium]